MAIDEENVSRAEVAEAKLADMKQFVDQLTLALDAARAPHQTPYVDDEHQGGNCVDVIMQANASAHQTACENVALQVRLSAVQSERDKAREKLDTLGVLFAPSTDYVYVYDHVNDWWEAWERAEDDRDGVGIETAELPEGTVPLFGQHRPAPNVDAERLAVAEARLAEIITELGVRPGTSHSFVMAHLRVHMNAASLYRDASNRLDRIDAVLESFRHTGPALPTTMLARIQDIVREKWACRKSPVAAEAVGDKP